MRATIFYKSFFKNILLYMSGGLSKIRSLYTYILCTGCFILNGIVGCISRLELGSVLTFFEIS